MVAPFHAFVRINRPDGNKDEFFANMTCSESNVTDADRVTLISTTWSLNNSMEAIVANVMVNKTKALTGGRDGHDSNNWFYRGWLG